MMNTESRSTPQLRPDFAERVVRQARLVQRQRAHRRVTLAVGALAALLVGGVSLVSSPRKQLRRNVATTAFVEPDEGTTLTTTDALLSTLEYSSGDRGDDPAAYFFPDSETLLASD